jgi:predicted RNase H-like HicB family nuclease
MSMAATFTARLVRDGEWFVAFSPEIPEGNGQGLTEEEALESLRESILLLLEDRREDARASLGSGEKLVPLVRNPDVASQFPGTRKFPICWPAKSAAPWKSRSHEKGGTKFAYLIRETSNSSQPSSNTSALDPPKIGRRPSLK